MYSVWMSFLVQIRNVPDDVRATLKARAAQRGESFNSFLLELLRREAARPSVHEVLDRAARRSERATDSALGVVSSARAGRERAGGGRRG
jgi:plasmid stability protein